MRSSAARACARLFSASTVMKALSEPFSFSTRSRKSRVSSTLEISFARARPKLFERGVQHGIQDSGPTFLPPTLRLVWSAIRSPSEPDRVPAPSQAPAIGIAPLVSLGHDVFAQAQFEVLSMRHRLDTLGVDLPHPPDQLEDVVQLRLYGPGFRVAHADSASSAMRWTSCRDSGMKIA